MAASRYASCPAGFKHTYCFFLVLCAALWLTSALSYLLFHSIVEMTSIAIAAAVFMISWSSRGYAESAALRAPRHRVPVRRDPRPPPHALLPGHERNPSPATPPRSGCRAPGCRPSSPSHSSCLRGAAARALPACLPGRGGRGGASVLSIFAWNIFPLCFVEGQGVTLFKKLSEYVISAILLVSIALLAGRTGAIARSAAARRVRDERRERARPHPLRQRVRLPEPDRTPAEARLVLLAYQALFATKVRGRLSLIEELQQSRPPGEERGGAPRRQPFQGQVLLHPRPRPPQPPGRHPLPLGAPPTRFGSTSESARCATPRRGEADGKLLECILQWARAQTGRLEVFPSAIALAELCGGIALAAKGAAEKGRHPRAAWSRGPRRGPMRTWPRRCCAIYFQCREVHRAGRGGERPAASDDGLGADHRGRHRLRHDPRRARQALPHRCALLLPRHRRRARRRNGPDPLQRARGAEPGEHRGAKRRGTGSAFTVSLPRPAPAAP